MVFIESSLMFIARSVVADAKSAIVVVVVSILLLSLSVIVRQCILSVITEQKKSV